MANSVRVDLVGLAEFEAAMKRAPGVVGREFYGFIVGAIAHLEGEVKQRTPTTHGTLRASIAGRVSPLAGASAIEGVVGTSLSYAVPVEIGTRPHTPPIEPLVDWAIQKFGLDDKDARRVAFGVAYRIAQRGTPAVGMFHGALAVSRARLVAGARAALQRGLAKVGGAQ